MGGSGGGGIPSDNFRKLEERAKQELKKASTDVSPHVFISFAFEDEDEVNLFRGQAKNKKTDLQFDDFSLKEEIKSNDEDYIKRKIRERIDRCSVTAVYLSKDSAASKWVNWEIEESVRRGKRVIGVHKGDAPPANKPQAFVDNGCKCVKWSHEELNRAINEAAKQRE